LASETAAAGDLDRSRTIALAATELGIDAS
jgi:hypothetical protein